MVSINRFAEDGNLCSGRQQKYAPDAEQNAGSQQVGLEVFGQMQFQHQAEAVKIERLVHGLEKRGETGDERQQGGGEARKERG